MKEALREIYDLVGIAESQLQIKSVLATRSKNVMQIECDRKKGQIEDDRLSRWEDLMNDLLTGWKITYTYHLIGEPENAVVVPKVKEKDVEAPPPEDGVLYGKLIKKNEITAICIMIS